MKKEDILSVLSEISFEDDPVQVLSLRPEGTDIDFPLTDGPLNFSVLSDGGLSVRWGVKMGEMVTHIYTTGRRICGEGQPPRIGRAAHLDHG